MASSTVVRNREPLELGRNGVVGSVPRRPAAAKAPKMAMKPVIRNSHRGSWFVPLELARDGVVGSVPRRPTAAKAPKTAMKPVIRNSHRGSWLVPLELARDGVVGSVPRRPAAAKALDSDKKVRVAQRAAQGHTRRYGALRVSTVSRPALASSTVATWGGQPWHHPLLLETGNHWSWVGMV